MYHFNHWLHCNKYLILSFLILSKYDKENDVRAFLEIVRVVDV